MAFNPDAREKTMGGHVYNVEGGVDLTAFGFPGLTFEGDVDIEIDADGAGWYVESAHARDARGNIYRYGMREPLGEAIAEAIYADTCHSQHILDACWYHGED
jgi:hypothetical protein